MKRFISYQPVFVNDWIVNLSVHEGFNIIMIHRFEHTCKCAYVQTSTEANAFICKTVLQNEKVKNGTNK